jgi:hypothetical protein
MAQSVVITAKLSPSDTITIAIIIACWQTSEATKHDTKKKTVNVTWTTDSEFPRWAAARRNNSLDISAENQTVIITKYRSEPSSMDNNTKEIDVDYDDDGNPSCLSRLYSEETKTFHDLCLAKFPNEVVAESYFLACCDVASKWEVTVEKKAIFVGQGEWAIVLMYASKGVSIFQLIDKYLGTTIISAEKSDKSTVMMVARGCNGFEDEGIRQEMEVETTVWFLHRLGLTGGVCFGNRWSNNYTRIIINDYISLHRSLVQQFGTNANAGPGEQKAMTPRTLYEACHSFLDNALKKDDNDDIILDNFYEEYFSDPFLENYHYLTGAGVTWPTTEQNGPADDTMLGDGTAALIAAAHVANLVRHTQLDDCAAEYQDEYFNKPYEENIQLAALAEEAALERARAQIALEERVAARRIPAAVNGANLIPDGEDSSMEEKSKE